MQEAQRKKNVLATLLYFDAIDRSLTATEVWRWCLDAGRISSSGEEGVSRGRFSLKDILGDLDELVAKKVLVFSSGMYTIAASSDRIGTRKRAMKISDEKLRNLSRWARWLRFVPFVRGIIATGGLASKNADEKSDWDVLIVAKAGRIWTARTAMTAVTHLLGKRRHGEYVRDRWCLNHFITDKHLKMGLRDVFSAKEYVTAVPLGEEELFRRFLRSNLWMRTFFPQWELPRARHIRTAEKFAFGERGRSVLEKLLDWDVLERWLRSWQKRKIENNPKTKDKESYIVANDEALIFLPSPRGPKVFERFKERVFSHAEMTR